MARSADLPPQGPKALPPPPPFAPDPDLVDHMEDNRWLIRRWRDATKRDAARARQRYDEATSRHS